MSLPYLCIIFTLSSNECVLAAIIVIVDFMAQLHEYLSFERDIPKTNNILRVRGINVMLCFQPKVSLRSRKTYTFVRMPPFVLILYNIGIQETDGDGEIHGYVRERLQIINKTVNLILIL